MFAASRTYALDIETDTRVDGLDPRVAAVTEVSLSTATGDQVFDDAAGERALLERLDAALRALPPGLVVTWNGAFFDLPFLSERYTRAGLTSPGLHLVPSPGLQPKYDFLPGHDVAYTMTWASADPASPHQHLDISFAYRGVAAELGVPHSLKPVSRALGIDVIEVNRALMHRLTPLERSAYAASDTRATRALALARLGA